MKKILIIGATSGIAVACARLLGEKGYQLFPVARNKDRLEVVLDDLTARGHSISGSGILDVAKLEEQESAIARFWNEQNGFDVVLIAHGVLGDQARAEQDVLHAMEIVHTNYSATISLLTILSRLFEKQQSGTIAVITSVAGDRGRGSNYVYGSTKAGVSAFLSGLRQRLYAAGVNVLDAKPGITDTAMTAGMKKGPLMSSPESVASSIVNAIESRKPMVYAPWFWYWIMLIIRMIPERLFVHVKI